MEPDIERVATLLMRRMVVAGGKATRNQLRTSLPHRDRKYFEDAIAYCGADLLVEFYGNGWRRYRLNYKRIGTQPPPDLETGVCPICELGVPLNRNDQISAHGQLRRDYRGTYISDELCAGLYLLPLKEVRAEVLS